ncbi:cold-shock protein [Planobispora rosea]|uniref:cold-shock protein n=1 Tax=Planobispora rosea TaxID=35762 RepID=UPI000839E46D|nr:cold shock domain-containing protein [Planobispora rosea]
MDEVTGTVVSWDGEEGWGVLASPGVPGEVWVHFSAIEAPPGRYCTLNEGEEVLFTWEHAMQDGFACRAVAVTRQGTAAGPGAGEVEEDTAAYSSSLEIIFDGPHAGADTEERGGRRRP